MKKTLFLSMGLLAAMAFSPPVSACADPGSEVFFQEFSGADIIHSMDVGSIAIFARSGITDIAQESAPLCSCSAVSNIMTPLLMKISVNPAATVNGTYLVSISGTSMAVRTDHRPWHHGPAAIIGSGTITESLSTGDKASAHPGGDLRLQG